MFNNIALSQEAIQIILGGYFGDAYIPKDPKKRLIGFSHSDKQKEYLDWKKSFFNINLLHKDATRYYKEGYIGHSFALGNKDGILSDFYVELKRYIYTSDGRRKLSPQLLNALTPMGLAVWWMDDGCLSVHKGNRYGKLCTHSFNYEEHIIIKKYFEDVWNITPDIRVEKRKYYFLKFNVAELKKLFTLIYPYVIQIPSMIYKIDFNYKNQSSIGDFQEVYDIIENAKRKNIVGDINIEF